MDISKLEITKTDDVSLIHSIALHQKEALGALYDRYSPLAYSLALSSVEDEALAEKIVQDVFTQVWEKASTYDATQVRVNSWIINITRNRAFAELRKGEIPNGNIHVSWSEENSDGSLNDIGSEEEIDLAMQKKLVLEALNTLSPGEQEALALAFFRGYSHHKIAEILGISVDVARIRIRSAMKKLR